MTREEAIRALGKVKSHFKFSGTFWDDTRAEACEALDMAVEALQTEVVRCKDCKHRPCLKNENHSDYGFNVIGDETCPCVNEEDGWYSWMPKDNFYCGFGERR